MADSSISNGDTGLWKLCAGALVDIPSPGERVFYFLQGHLEQLEASLTHEELNPKISLFNIPSKILCRVVNIQLLAERETDEAYAEITLHPESNHSDRSERTIPKQLVPVPPNPETYSFCKILSANDISNGGLFIRRQDASKCFPPLDMNQDTQNLVAKDLHGHEWTFKHKFTGETKRHFLTTGWGKFVSNKKLVPGDALVMLRDGNGELHIGIRRTAHERTRMPSILISRQTMHLGVLETASHAVMTSTLLVVYYWPRARQFIVGFNKYHEAINNNFSLGIDFQMQVEGEGYTIRRHIFTGTIVEVGDVSPLWSESKWQSLKVQWDEHATIPRPTRVSPWEIEPLSIPLNVTQPMSKRLKLVEIASSDQLETAKKLESSSGFRFSNDLLMQTQRRRTKVHMFGVDVGRAVYLATLKGYNDLNVVLEQMFEINGELHQTSKWAVICIDNANHMMHLGNLQWATFCKMVKKIYIYSIE